MRDEKDVEGGRKNNTKHSKETSCSTKQDRLEPTSPSNVTQAAIHNKSHTEKNNNFCVIFQQVVLFSGCVLKQDIVHQFSSLC